jgi:photosystem II stability/assembly factor-like uncharacterized protein
MAKMLFLGKEIIRINPKDSKKIEVSTNDGRTWSSRFSGNSSVGEFDDLINNGKEILAATNKGLFVSTNDGRTWSLRSR